MSIHYQAPDSVESAIAILAHPSARPMGGGTDLLVAMEVGLDSADAVVDLTKVAALAGIESAADGSLKIGAATRLDVIGSDATVRAKFPALAAAVGAVGTPALRATGTLGGNLCQRPRCWYLRSRFACHKNGGTGCPAMEGENQYHAIVGGGPCYAAHPSDAAVALNALDASVTVRGPDGTRTLSIDTLYRDAASNPASETTLAAGEWIEAITIPAASAGGTQWFTKLMQRGAWDFATVSLAGIKRADGTVRLVFGGVAPAPWRVNPSVEEDVASGELDQDSVDALAERAFYDAAPLARNGYKVQQASALLKRAMLELSRA